LSNSWQFSNLGFSLMMDFASLSVVTPGVIPNKQGAAQVVS